MINENITLERVCEVVFNAGEYLLKEQQQLQPGMVEIKALNSLVTYVDKTTEAQLVKGLGKLLPGSVFLTEEDTIDNRDGEWQWIIDPLDGTTNYIHQLHVFSISVALRHNDEIVLGIIHCPKLGETFTAEKGKGAFLNGKQIHVSRNEKLSDTLLCTGFPYFDFHLLDQYISALKNLMGKTRGIRRMGSAAIDLCYTACGRFDGYFEYSLSPWDVAAGGLIVKEAGGVVMDFKEGDNWLFGGEICAGNPAIAKQLLDNFNRRY